MTKQFIKQLLIFGLVIGVFIFVALELVLYFEVRSQEKSVAANPDSAPALSLSNFYPVAGTSYYLADISNDKPSNYLEYSSSRWFSFGSGDQIRNLVFLDSKTLSSRKLYDTNKSFILSVAAFPEQETYPNPDDKVVPVQWFVYYVVHQDTNNDGLLDGNDLGILAISDYTGLRYKEIISSIVNLYEITLPEEGRLMAIYSLTGGRYASLIDLNTQEIFITQPIPNLGPEVD